MIRKLMASSAVIALLSAGAITIAQAQTDPAKPAIVQDNTTAAQDNATNAAPAATEVAASTQNLTQPKPTLATVFIGRSVYSSADPQSDNIGDVNDLIVSENGAITHAVIGVGGFLGIGEKNVAVPFDQLKVVEQDGDIRLVYAATKEQLEAAPAFDRTAYDPAARAPKTNTAANDTTGTVVPVAPATDQMAAGTSTDNAAGTADQPVAPATDQMAAGTSTDKVTGTAPTNANAPAMQDFVQKAAIANMFEIQSSQLARDHSQNGDVKTFAQKMIDDHTKAGDDMKAAVNTANAGLTVPDALDQQHKDMPDKLQSAKGADFDRQYVDIQVKAHDDTVQLFQSYADSGDNSAIQQFAQNTLPTLQQHQKMVQDLSDKLGSNNTAMSTTNEQPAANTDRQTAAADNQPANTATVGTGEPGFVNVSADQIRASTLIGQRVYGPENESIGKISDLVLEKEGDTRVALVDVGGFLGIGSKTVALPFTDLKFSKPDANSEPQVNVAMTKDQLKSLPKYDKAALDTASTAAPANGTATTGAAPDTTTNTMADAPPATAPSDQLAAANNQVTGSINRVPVSQDIAASSLMGAAVYSTDNKSIGEVGDIVFDPQGNISAVVVDVGGFLGIGKSRWR